MMNGRSKHILLCLSLGFTIASIATDKASNSKKRAYSETVESKTRYHCLHPGCNKSYSTKKILKQHEVIHSAEPRHTCPICRNVFWPSANLKFHMHTHTGARPYKCLDCGRAFTRPDILKVHMRTHTNERPYKCPFPDCGSAFKQLGTLKDHMRTHTKDAKISAITVPAGSPTAASAPIPHLSAAGCDLPVSTDLPQNPDEMDELDGFLEKVPWKS